MKAPPLIKAAELIRTRRVSVVILIVLTVFLIPFQICAQIAIQAWFRSYWETGTSSGFSGAVATAIDKEDNVFVTGLSWSETNSVCVTLGYSNAGVPLWTNRYDAPGNLSTAPSAIAVDCSGNVFVTGSTYVLPESPAGHPTDYSYVTLAYSGSGVPLWTNTYSVAGEDHAMAVAVDKCGNVFVTGNSAESTNSHVNMTTIAYSGAGVPVWTNRYRGIGIGGASYASSMAVDNQGNAFVVGGSNDSDNHQQIALIAYSNAGTPLWKNLYIGPTIYGDYASGVAVDSGGSVFVTGASHNTNGFSDYLTLAFSREGVPLWTNRYNTGNASVANAIAVDSGGNVFVTGQSWSAVGFPDYATVGYSGTGVPLWTNRYDGPVHRDDNATAVAVDGSGNVFVTGYSTGVTSNYDYVTIGYSSGGTPMWTNRYDGLGKGSDQAEAIAVDKNGNAFVTGNSWNGINFEFASIKYSIVEAPPILIQPLSNQIVVNWTNTLFNLQTAPTLSDNFTNVPGATSPYTNTIIGDQRFFRLISQGPL